MNKSREYLTYGFCHEAALEISKNIPDTIAHLILLYNTKYQIFACGDNYGELSLDYSNNNKNTFTQLIELENITTNVENININYRSMMVIDEYHSIYVVGCNNWDRLGTKSIHYPSYTDIPHFRKIQLNEKAILTSKGINNGLHTFIYTLSDKLYANGRNYEGRFGNGVHETMTAKPTVLSPIPRFWNQNERIIDIRCGNDHSLFLTNNSNVYACGSNREGQSGIKNNDIKSICQPQLIHKNTKQIAVGDYLSVLLEINGHVVIFGSFGSNDQNIPKQIAANFKNKSIKTNKVCCGYYHGLVLTTNNECYSFGDNTNGQCGNGQKTNTIVTDPYLIPFYNEYVIQMSCGFRHNIVLTNKNNVYTFGSNMSKECSPCRLDKNDILSPYLLDKEKELNIHKTSFVEHVVATSQTNSIIIINPNKKLSIYA